MCLTNYGASEAVNLCSRYPNVRNKNAPVAVTVRSIHTFAVSHLTCITVENPPVYGKP